MKKLILLAAMPAMSAGLLAMLTACEKPITPEGDDGNVHLTFVPTTHDVTTRGTVSIGDYFSRLAVQMFDADGNKVWDKVKTQSRDDDDFGTLSVGVVAGTYTVVAVGHSSPVTPTIKSPEMVQFTAKDGVKNSDTFCYCGTVTIDEDHTAHELRMNRMTAMVMFELTDETLPESYAGVRAEYTGGSANFNQTTSEGCTKSTQSELRGKNALYFFTFPYLSDEGKLKITISALDADQNVLTTKTLTDVPVTRNRITHCQGTLFGDGDFTIYQTAFGISVNTDWDGEDYYHF
jgi:hypothetical protein